jgi:hypothetical protein
MFFMFSHDWEFNQDLSSWCVSQIWTKPADFDNNTKSPWFRDNASVQPQWWTCPTS